MGDDTLSDQADLSHNDEMWRENGPMSRVSVSMGMLGVEWSPEPKLEGSGSRPRAGCLTCEYERFVVCLFSEHCIAVRYVYHHLNLLFFSHSDSPGRITALWPAIAAQRKHKVLG